MNLRLRQERNAFLVFLAAVFVSLFAAMPLLAQQKPEQQPEQKPALQQPVATAPAAPSLEFEQVDRNKDGVIDKSEAGVVPGLSANFERADKSKDGKLDKDEFERGLAIVAARK